MNQNLRPTFTRDELVTMLWALESIIEEAQWDGGLSLVQKETDLHEKLNGILQRYDLSRKPLG